MVKGCLLPIALCAAAFGLTYFAHSIDDSGVTPFLSWPASSIARLAMGLCVICAVMLAWRWLGLPKV
jgi:hypothetical protein